MPSHIATEKGESRRVFVPSGISSFFEICDRREDGSKISDLLQVGARGGGFIIKKGTITRASAPSNLRHDEVRIGNRLASEAITTLRVIAIMREKFDIPPVKISHRITPPIGQGFGTSGAGALATSIAISDLFDLKLTLSKTAGFAHVAEVQNLTGLGTVISLATGAGAIGLVTEPGTYSVGRTETILAEYAQFVLVCATFGPIEKSPILSREKSRVKINEYGRKTLTDILDDPTPERLLERSKIFSEKTGLASAHLLKLSSKALELGAIGATPNMIGNAIHCLINKADRERFLKKFSSFVTQRNIFESDLIQSGPRFI